MVLKRLLDPGGATLSCPKATYMLLLGEKTMGICHIHINHLFFAQHPEDITAQREK